MTPIKVSLIMDSISKNQLEEKKREVCILLYIHFGKEAETNTMPMILKLTADDVIAHHMITLDCKFFVRLLL